MATDHFCLIWNNFQNSILSALGNLQTCQDLVDVTLMCEGHNVKAHKVILSACSPYFRNLFKEHPCQHPIIILKDVTHSDLTALLQFMYQGEVMVSQDNLASFLKTAELLQISGLTGSNQSSTNADQKEKSSTKATPDTNVRKPPDIPEKVNDRLSTEVSFKKQKRDRSELENVRDNKNSYELDVDPLQSCSYESSSPIIVKTESLDKEYDEMDMEPGDASNPEQYDNNSSHLEEPSILERSLKAQSEILFANLLDQGEATQSSQGTFSYQGHFPERIPPTTKKSKVYRKCYVCTKNGLRSETPWECKTCKVPLHLSKCFEKYHITPKFLL